MAVGTSQLRDMPADVLPEYVPPTVEVQTEAAWKVAASLDLPRMIFVNKLDRERASLDRSLDSLRQSCGREVVPIQLPIGEERSFSGIVDLISMQAYTFGADGKATLVPTEFMPPAELPDDDFPFWMNTGRQLYHWHTGTMTRRSFALEQCLSGANVFPCRLSPNWLDPGCAPSATAASDHRQSGSVPARRLG